MVSSKPSRGKTSGVFKSDDNARAIVEPVIYRDSVAWLKSNNMPVFDWSLENLANWQVRQEQGSKNDDRTAFFHRAPRDAIVRQFDKTIGNPYFSGEWRSAPGAIPAFWDMEEDFKSKIGPMSLFLPWSLDGPKKVKAVWSDKPLDWGRINKQAYDQALQIIASILPRHSIGLTDLMEAINGLSGKPDTRLDTSTNGCEPVVVSGWKPSKSSGDRNKSREREIAYKYIVQSAGQYLDMCRSANDPSECYRPALAIAGQRTNVMKGPDPLHNEKAKRLVVAMPKDINTVPGKCNMTLIQQQLTQFVNATNGMPVIAGWYAGETVDYIVQELLHYAHANGFKTLSGDISAFDATLPPQVMEDVATAFSECLTKASRNVFLSIIHTDIHDTTIVTPIEIVAACTGSVKSGSIYTALIGCLCNLFIQLYGHYAGYYRLHVIHVQGDDFVGCGENYNEETIGRPFADFGMDANKTKQYVAFDSCTFLKRYYVYNSPGGIYSAYTVLGKLMSTENDIKLRQDERNSWVYTFKALAQLNNASFNPMFDKLVAFAIQGDPNHLGRDIPASAVAKQAGSFAERYTLEALNKPWADRGWKRGFDALLVNGVVRGEKLPSSRQELFARVYGKQLKDCAPPPGKYFLRVV